MFLTKRSNSGKADVLGVNQPHDWSGSDSASGLVPFLPLPRCECLSIQVWQASRGCSVSVLLEDGHDKSVLCLRHQHAILPRPW